MYLDVWNELESGSFAVQCAIYKTICEPELEKKFQRLERH